MSVELTEDGARVALHAGEADPWTLESQGPPRPPADVLADVDAVARSPQRQLVLWGCRPLTHPDLPAIVDAARRHGLRVTVEALVTRDTPLHAPVDELRVPLHGPAATHDALTGAPGSWVATLRALAHAARISVRTRHTCHGGPRAVEAVAPWVRDRAVRWLLDGDGEPVDAAPLLARLVDALRGSTTHLHLRGLHVPPGPLDLARPPDAPDPHHLAAREDGGWTGRRVEPASRWAHLLGLAPGPVPPTARPALGPRPVILAPGMGDVLLAASTLPALARALTACGRDVRLESVWAPPWNLHLPPPRGDLPPADAPPPTVRPATSRLVDTARRFDPDLWRYLDLSGATDVIAPGWDAGWRAWTHPTLPADARLWVIDLHMLVGHGRWAGVTPWPDRVEVVSCFPGFAPMYARAGVPVDRVVWRPYPLALDELPPGGPVTDAPAWVVAGNHRRDHGLLVDAARRLRGTRPLRWFTSHPAPVDGTPLHPAGVVPIEVLYRHLQAARAVVLPVRSSPTDAAGISLCALALAAGRPVVGTWCWGLADHLRDGVDAALVPADDRALAEVIAALDADDAGVARLAEGARAAREALGVEAWARAWTGGDGLAWPTR